MAELKKYYFDTALRRFLDYQFPFRNEFYSLDRYVDGSFVEVPVRDENQRVNARIAGQGGYPMLPQQREHDKVKVPMESTETIPEYIPDARKFQTSYDAVTEHLNDHFTKLNNDSAEEIAHSVAPAVGTATAPVLLTSGPAKLNGEKALVKGDIKQLATRWNKMKLPQEGRFLVLTADHLDDLATDDEENYNQIINFTQNPAQNGINYFGFRIMMYSDTVFYDVSTGVRKVRGALGTSNDLPASFAWVKSEVGRAYSGDNVIMNPVDVALGGCSFMVWATYKTQSLRPNLEGTAAIRYTN